MPCSSVSFGAWARIARAAPVAYRYAPSKLAPSPCDQNPRYEIHGLSRVPPPMSGTGRVFSVTPSSPQTVSKSW